MKKLQLILIILLVSLLAAPAVLAQNMSISKLDMSGRQDVFIYTSDGVLRGTYNTSSPVVPLPTEDFQMVIKPTTASRVLDPVSLFSDFVDFMLINWVPVFWILAIVAVIAAMYKKGRGR